MVVVVFKPAVLAKLEICKRYAVRSIHYVITNAISTTQDIVVADDRGLEIVHLQMITGGEVNERHTDIGMTEKNTKQEELESWKIHNSLPRKWVSEESFSEVVSLCHLLQKELSRVC